MPKAKRTAYNVAFKLKAIQLAIKKGNRKAAIELCINESMVRKWRLQKDQLSASTKTRKAFRGNKARWPELEAELEDWVNIQGDNERGLSNVKVRLKAIEMAKQKGLDNFTGNETWYYRFMRRKGLSLHPGITRSHRLPADLEVKLNDFQNFTNGIILEHVIGGDDIVNMDKVLLTFDIPLTKTVTSTVDSSVSIKTTGHEKTHLTIVLSCCISGKKLPTKVIFKRKNEHEDNFPSGVVVKVNPEGRINEEQMVDWLEGCYSKRPGDFFHLTKTVQSMENLRVNISEQIKSLNSISTIIPGGTTKFPQPLDISVNRCFKLHLRELWEKWISEERSFTKTARCCRQESLPEVYQWILSAWQ